MAFLDGETHSVSPSSTRVQPLACDAPPSLECTAVRACFCTARALGYGSGSLSLLANLATPHAPSTPLPPGFCPGRGVTHARLGAGRKGWCGQRAPHHVDTLNLVGRATPTPGVQRTRPRPPRCAESVSRLTSRSGYHIYRISYTHSVYIM